MAADPRLEREGRTTEFPHRHDEPSSPRGADLLAATREQWGIVRGDPFPYTVAQLVAARDELEHLADRRDAVPVGGDLTVEWSMPAATRERGK